MDNRKVITAYEQHKEEKAKRRGTGFVGFLSDLDWMLSLEIEEGRPLDHTKITTAQKFHTFNQGLVFGLALHTPVLFIGSFLIYTLLWSLHIESSWGVHAIWFLSVLFSLTIKIYLPKWLIDEYYIFPKGITYTYLSWFLAGYTLGLFIPEFIYFIAVVTFILFYQVFNEPLMYYQWWKKASYIIAKYLPHFAELKWIPVHFFLLLLSFSPILLLKLHRKRHPFQETKYMPLDFIPKDE